MLYTDGKKTKKIACLLLCLVLLLGTAFSALAATRPAAIRVTSIAPALMELQAGGAGQKLTVGGAGLGRLTSAQVLAGNQLAVGITAELLDPADAARELLISAQANAESGDYRLRLTYGVVKIDIPERFFSLKVSPAAEVAEVEPSQDAAAEVPPVTEPEVVVEPEPDVAEQVAPVEQVTLVEAPVFVTSSVPVEKPAAVEESIPVDVPASAAEETIAPEQSLVVESEAAVPVNAGMKEALPVAEPVRPEPSPEAVVEDVAVESPVAEPEVAAAAQEVVEIPLEPTVTTSEPQPEEPEGVAPAPVVPVAIESVADAAEPVADVTIVEPQPQETVAVPAVVEEDAVAAVGEPVPPASPGSMAIRVSSFDPSELVLVPGEPGQQVSIEGTGLGRLTGAQVLRDKLPVSEITAELLETSVTARQLLITAGDTVEAGHYSLRLVYGVMRIDIPETVFSVNVQPEIEVEEIGSRRPVPAEDVKPVVPAASQPQVVAPASEPVRAEEAAIKAAEKIIAVTPRKASVPAPVASPEPVSVLTETPSEEVVPEEAVTVAAVPAPVSEPRVSAESTAVVPAEVAEPVQDVTPAMVESPVAEPPAAESWAIPGASRTLYESEPVATPAPAVAETVEPVVAVTTVPVPVAEPQVVVEGATKPAPAAESEPVVEPLPPRVENEPAAKQVVAESPAAETPEPEVAVETLRSVPVPMVTVDEPAVIAAIPVPVPEPQVVIEGMTETAPVAEVEATPEVLADSTALTEQEVFEPEVAPQQPRDPAVAVELPAVISSESLLGEAPGAEDIPPTAATVAAAVTKVDPTVEPAELSAAEPAEDTVIATNESIAASETGAAEPSLPVIIPEPQVIIAGGTNVAAEDSSESQLIASGGGAEAQPIAEPSEPAAAGAEVTAPPADEQDQAAVPAKTAEVAAGASEPPDAESAVPDEELVGADDYFIVLQEVLDNAEDLFADELQTQEQPASEPQGVTNPAVDDMLDELATVLGGTVGPQTGVRLDSLLLPGEVTISASGVTSASGGVWLAPDARMVLAEPIDVRFTCSAGSSLTRANVYTVASLSGPDVTFAVGDSGARTLHFSSLPVIGSEILRQFCPAGLTAPQKSSLKQNLQAEWVCASEMGVEMNSESLGQLAVTILCDAGDSRASTLELTHLKYECPEGYVVEGTDSAILMSTDISDKGGKKCVRP